MQILLVSDLHYTLPQLDWLVGSADRFDLVVIAGDLLDISSSVSLDAQVVVIQNYLQLVNQRTRLIVSSGNHDLTGEDPNGERSALWMSDVSAAGIATDGQSVKLNELLVTICPWWDGPVGRSTVDAQLTADATRRPPTWTWVYHWPPVGSPTSWTGTRHYGDPDLVEWIATHQPEFVFTGHVHEPPFKPDGGWVDRVGSTWVFNPGRQIGPIPTRIEIDLGAHTATWASMMGSETIDLSAAAPPARTLV